MLTVNAEPFDGSPVPDNFLFQDNFLQATEGTYRYLQELLLVTQKSLDFGQKVALLILDMIQQPETQTTRFEAWITYTNIQKWHNTNM